MNMTWVQPKGPISTVIRQIQVAGQRRAPRTSSGSLTLRTPQGTFVRARRRSGSDSTTIDVVPRWG